MRFFWIAAIVTGCGGGNGAADSDDGAVDGDEPHTGTTDTDTDPSTAPVTDPNAWAALDFGIVMIGITPEVFIMGCTDEMMPCQVQERPPHPVTLTRDFYLGRTEVTQDQWRQVMGNEPALFGDCGVDCPIESVNWWEAAAFANTLSALDNQPECYNLDGCVGIPGEGMSCTGASLQAVTVYDCTGYRFATEAEWEFAARAPNGLAYSGSDDVNDVAWTGINAFGTVHPVAQLLPNTYGLYDMSGNVWEWTSDPYDPEYYDISPTEDPAGPAPGLKQAVRSGAWNYNDSYSRVSRRAGMPLDLMASSVGFRLARTAP